MKSHSPKNGLILCKHDTYIQKITPLDFQAKHFAPVYMYLHLDIEMTKEPFFASYDVDITFFRLFDWHFRCFLSTEKKGRVYTPGVGASLTWESTPSKSSCTPEWGQAWTGRALLGAPVLLPLQTGCQQRTPPPLPARDWTQTRLTTSSIS